MYNSLLKLLAVASEPIVTPPHAVEIEVLDPVGIHRADLFEMLCLKNGWYAFASALHVFPLGKREGVLDLETWNSKALWRDDYEDLAEGCFFFAEDIFGVQFCFKQGQIHTFDPETGQTRLFADDLSIWSSMILEDYEVHTGYPLARDWQGKYGPLKLGHRLLPKTLFAFQGPYTVDNLYELDCVEGMKFRASIAVQMRQIPSGTRVKLKVIR